MKQIQIRVSTYDNNFELVDEDCLILNSGFVLSIAERLRVYEADDFLCDNPVAYEGQTLVCKVEVVE